MSLNRFIDYPTMAYPSVRICEKCFKFGCFSQKQPVRHLEVYNKDTLSWVCELEKEKTIAESNYNNSMYYNPVTMSNHVYVDQSADALRVTDNTSYTVCIRYDSRYEEPVQDKTEDKKDVKEIISYFYTKR